MAVLQTHYRSTMEVGPATLAASAEAVKRLDALVRRAAAEGTDASQPASETEVVRFRAAMDDDLGTPSAIDVVFGAVRAANTAFDEGRIADAGERVATVVELSGVLGIMLGTEQSPGDDDDEIDVLVEQRNSARADRDFALADQLRDELAERGIVIEDGAGGTSWHRA